MEKGTVPGTRIVVTAPLPEVPFGVPVEKENIISIDEETIRLASFLKLSGALETGVRAKIVIQQGYVSVTGDIFTLRGRKIKEGDRVCFS